MKRLLERIGLIRVRHNGTIIWPFHVSPWWHLRVYLKHWPWDKHMPWFGLFRNLPHVVKWESGRLLPRRWGFSFLIFEFGDRGGCSDARPIKRDPR